MTQTELASLREKLWNETSTTEEEVRLIGWEIDSGRQLEESKVIAKDFKIVVDGDKVTVSDGYHTFDELYDHRCVLFAALIAEEQGLAWKSWKHADGSEFDGWFIAGMNLPTGTVTYHLPAKMWDYVYARELDNAPEWDGHTSADVVARLTEWVIKGRNVQ